MAPLTDSIYSIFARSALSKLSSVASASSIVERTALSPMAVHELHRRTDKAPNDKYNPGGGARAPDNFNKELFIILFALIGAGMVCTAIYFFFIAQNGGFHWKENDWEDYKTTVLRRKGPDGKTLSNATKSTKLGGGSIVPKWADKYSDGSQSTIADPEAGDSQQPPRGPLRQHHRTNRHDPEFNDYRHEKPAAVGGYNKPDEGSHYATTNTDPSTVSAGQKVSKKEKKERERREKEAKKQAAKEEKERKKNKSQIPESSVDVPQHPVQHPVPHPLPRPAATSTTSYSYTETGTSYTSPGSNVYGVPQPSPSAGPQSYYSNYRPGGQPTLRAVPEERLSQRSSPSGSNRHAAPGGYSHRQGSPRKQHRSEAQDSESYSGTGSDVGTKTYPCHIPGISRGQPQSQPQPEPSIFSGRDEVRPDESVSQVGAQQARRSYGGGFRRGQGGF